MKNYQKLLFLILDVALNGANYFFHIYVSWFLTEEDYGSLNALVAVCTILFTAGVTLQTYTAKTVSEPGGRGQPLYAVRRVGYAVLLVYTVLLAGLHPMLEGLTRSGVTEMTLVALTLITHIVLCIQRGIFQGERRFMDMNGSMYAEVGAKLLVLFILLGTYPRVSTVLLAIWAGMLASLLHSWYKNRSSRRIWFAPSDAKPSWRQIGAGLSGILIGQFFFYFFTSFDMIVVNYYLPQESGGYAVILRFAQLILFIGSSIIVLLLPEFTARKYEPAKLWAFVKKCLSIAAILSALAIGMYRFVAPYALPVLFGEQYRMSPALLTLSAVMYAGFTVCSLFIYVNIALDRTRHLYYIGAATVLLVSLVYAFHSGIRTVMLLEAAAYFLLSAVLFTDLNRHLRKAELDGNPKKKAPVYVMEGY